MNQSIENDQIVALATPYGTSALAVIRTSGPGVVETIATMTDRKDVIAATPGGRMKRTTLLHRETGTALDEVVLGIYRTPASYTGEDMVEIYCHGSPSGIDAILAALLRSGMRAAEGGEFTQRAFLAGKLDLTRAEAVQEVVRSRTAQGHAMALQRLGGAVFAAIDAIKQDLVRLMAPVAIQLDYPEEETGPIPFPLEPVFHVRKRIEELAGSYRTGRLYQEGIVLVLAGRPNAGKSSLFNALLKEDRAIVSEVPGTTRDYIESSLDLGGIPVRVFDTAGLRVTGESIEGEGIRRTRQVIQTADSIVYVVDGMEGITAEDTAFIQELSAEQQHRLVLVWNKTDIPDTAPPPAGYLPVSAQTQAGIGAVVEAIMATVVPADLSSKQSVIIDSLRQRDLLNQAADSLSLVIEGIQGGMPLDAVGLDLQEAIHALGEITGEVTSADILEQVFSGFCVGK